MKQALIKKGLVYPLEIPEPSVKAGFIKIKVYHSCISSGTEMSGVTESRKSLLQKAIERPQKIMNTYDYIKDRGLKKTKNKINTITDNYSESGYSIAGKIVEIGNDISNFNIGDLVAAGGMRLAVHAEYVVVPKNLVVKIPAGLDTLYASTATVGSISLHGVRRADLKIGEYGVVLGVGLLGLIAIQLLKNSGVRVACIDVNDHRLNLAKSLGAEIIVNPTTEDSVNAIKNWSSGYGADAVLFTASTSSNEPLSNAFQMCRKKGKVVLVGVSGMNIERKNMYRDEIDFLISTSYGPGRYDDNYELKGIDYPYHYVRWTENRNMGEFLRLINEGQLDFQIIKPNIYPFQLVSKAFDDLEKDPDQNILSILEYDKIENDKVGEKEAVQIVSTVHKKGIINVGLIGAGGFASNTLLPIINELPDKYKLHTVVNRGGKKAFDVQRQFNALHSSASVNDILNNPEIDLVLISTRHDNHAELVLQSLKAGKNVFVEKPLAVNKEQFSEIRNFYNNCSSDIEKPMLIVGFNRRFSPYIQEVKKHAVDRINPLFMHYRMNAGFAPANSWVHDDGGRIIGEACHIIDLMIYLTGSHIKEVSVSSLKPVNNNFSSSDNKSFTLSFIDGSVAVIDYFAIGNKKYPKEFLEVHYDSKTITVNDYKQMLGYGIKVAKISSKISKKGHYEEWIEIYNSLTSDDSRWPIELSDLIQTTEISFLISEL